MPAVVARIKSLTPGLHGGRIRGGAENAEELVEFALSGYERRGVAVVRRVPDPWKIVRRSGKAAEAYPAKKGLVDYLGVWCGAAVAFDCKETGSRFELGKVPEHQLEFLSAWERYGALRPFSCGSDGQVHLPGFRQAGVEQRSKVFPLKNARAKAGWYPRGWGRRWT